MNHMTSLGLSPIMRAVLTWTLRKLQETHQSYFHPRLSLFADIVVEGSPEASIENAHTRGRVIFPLRWLSSKILPPNSLNCAHAHASSCAPKMDFCLEHACGGSIPHPEERRAPISTYTPHPTTSPWYVPAAGLHVVVTAAHAASGTLRSVVVSVAAACVWAPPAPAAAAGPGGL